MISPNKIPHSLNVINNNKNNFLLIFEIINKSIKNVFIGFLIFAIIWFLITGIFSYFFSKMIFRYLLLFGISFSPFIFIFLLISRNNKKHKEV